MASKHQLPEWKADLSTLPKSGKKLTYAASDDEKNRIARYYGLAAIDMLSVELKIEPWSRSGVRISGAVSADLVQTCVISLDPIPATLTQHFVRTFSDQSRHKSRRDAPQLDIEVLLEEDDPPEPLTGHSIDLWPVVLEHFALALDPYPRKQDAGIQADLAAGKSDADDAAPVSPFAVLEKLNVDATGANDKTGRNR